MLVININLFTVAVRKVTEKRKQVEGKLERRDVIKDYSNYDSQTYAPMSRVGVFLDRGSEQYVVKSSYLSTYQGLLELEASLPDFVTRPRVFAPKPKSAYKGGFVKRRQRRQQELDEVAKAIEHSKKSAASTKPLRFLEKVEKPIPRPPTPSVHVPSQVMHCNGSMFLVLLLHSLSQCPFNIVEYRTHLNEIIIKIDLMTKSLGRRR